MLPCLFFCSKLKVISQVQEKGFCKFCQLGGEYGRDDDRMACGFDRIDYH